MNPIQKPLAQCLMLLVAVLTLLPGLLHAQEFEIAFDVMVDEEAAVEEEAGLSYALSSPTNENLSDVWLKDKHTGWAVGNKGTILTLNSQGTWQVYSNEPVSTQDLDAIAMTADGQEGWIVGDEGEILHYAQGQWQRYAGADTLKIPGLLDVWVSPDGSKGWAVGLQGTLLYYTNGVWQKHEGSGKVPRNLYTVWLDPTGSYGWAMGRQFVLQYEDGEWFVDPVSNHIQHGIVVDMAMDASGKNGWAVGSNHILLRCKAGKWAPFIAPSSAGMMYSVWVSPNGQKGFIVGAKGIVLELSAVGVWTSQRQLQKATENGLWGVAALANGAQGYIVGEEGTVISLMEGTPKASAEEAPNMEEVSFDDEPRGADDNDIFQIVEDMPEPKGGYDTFYAYVAENMEYPPQAKRMGIEGRVFVQFIVGKDGSISDIKALKGIGAGCDEEAQRIISEMPNWKPGRQRGRPVKVRMQLPITFKL